MLNYILNSSTCLAIFLIVYKTIFENTNFHVFKRYFLICIAIISLLIPLITYTEYVQPPKNDLIINEKYFYPTILKPKQPIENLNFTPIFVFSIYILGVIILLFRLLRNLNTLLVDLKTNPSIVYHNYSYVLSNKPIAPYTFFKYIFLSSTQYNKNLIPDSILLHEQTHAKQLHSIDILFIELLQLVFWFNPLYYFLKKMMKLNHEFLADSSVIKAKYCMKNYQQLLISYSSHTIENPLTNSIHYSSIKKRLTIMKTHTSKKLFFLKSCILLPVLAILIYGFSSKKEVYITKTTIKKTEFPGTKPLDSVVNDIYIYINSENTISINGKLTTENRLLADINSYNTNLTIDQKREFIIAEIKHQNNTSKHLIDKIKQILYEAEIWACKTINVELSKKSNYIEKPNLPLFSLSELSDKDKLLYEYKLNKYKKWLEVNEPNSKLEETKNGFVIKNEKNQIVLSTDPEIKSDSKKTKKDSSWSVKNSIKSDVTSLVFDVDNLNELKNFDWNSLKEIFKENNENTLITIEFNYNHEVLIEGIETDAFHLKITDKTSRLDEMIEKSKTAIGNLKVK